MTTTDPPPPLVLLIDDEPGLRRLLARTLDTSGYGVEAYENLAAATERLKQEPTPCLLIVDVDLPDGSGRVFADRLRGAGMAMPVLLISGRPSAIQNERRSGWAFLQKPFGLSAFIARVAKLTTTRQR